MENIQQIVNALIDEKAKENNTIDLNAYAIGALDALKKSKYTEMLEMLEEMYDEWCETGIGENKLSDYMLKTKQLIKEATEL